MIYLLFNELMRKKLKVIVLCFKVFFLPTKRRNFSFLGKIKTI